jgi:Flp pilus assembly pilin Flp
MRNLLGRLVRDEDGQDIIEYVLVAAAISVIAIPLVPQVGTAVQNAWTYVSGQAAQIPTGGGGGTP